MTDLSKILSTSCINRHGEKYIYSVNGNLFFKIDSKSIYNNKFPNDFFQESSLYVITGTDSGLFLEYFLNKEIPEGTRIIFVEFQEIIDWVHAEKKLHTPECISLIPPHQLIEHLSECEAEKYIYINKFYHIPSFAATDCHLDDYLFLNKKIAGELQTLHWNTTAQLNNKLFIINQLRNLPYNVNHVSKLYGRFRGQSALLLAGGPSLDLFIPWIQQHADRFIIIAVSRVCRRLLNASIQPDIIFSVDPQEISLDLSREMFHFADKSLFIHAYHAIHPMVAQWSGRMAYTGPLLPWESPLNIPDQLSGGVTVTNTALGCALSMGFSQIILCGVDLCYASDGRTHASCSKNSDDGRAVEGAETVIETNAGTFADTTYAYQTASQHIAYLATHEVATNCTLINPSRHAAKIDGVTFMELADIPITGELKNDTLLTTQIDGNLHTHCTVIKNELLKINKKLRKIINLSTTAKKENKLFFKNRLKNNSKSKKTIDKVQKELDSLEFRSTSQLIKTFGIDNFLKIITHKNEYSLNDKETEQYLDIYYESYKKSSKILLDLTNESLEIIESRLNEQNENPEFNALVKHWKKYNLPGRASNFPLLFPEIFSASPQSFKEECAKLKEQFNQFLQGATHYSAISSLNWSEWTEERRNKLLRKFIELFSEKDEFALEQLVDNTAQIEHQELQPFLYFAQGMLAEMQQHPAEASELYNKAISFGEETDRLLLEQTLKRIASLSLDNQDYENSLLALKCLFDISLSYAPQYAKLLKLTGRPHDALDIHAEYIEHFPDDLEQMLEMAALYQELGIEDGVKLLTDHILVKDPTNATALQIGRPHA